MSGTENEDERTSLLPNDQPNTLYRTLSRISEPAEPALPPDDTDTNATANKNSPASSSANVWATLSVLLVGVFISQTDASLVMAVYAKVASEFNDLDSGSWLMSAYILAQCVAQPLYGKLSDLFGRKALLQLSYILFAVGTAGAGLSMSMGAVIVSRAVQGAGSAGMLAMVSIIITDLVPMNEVAVFRSYVNILATSGRSCGGVIGGLLSSALGWRWAFLIQVPFILIAIILVQLKLRMADKGVEGSERTWDKLKRIDFIGAFFLCSTILAVCLILDLGGRKVGWTSQSILVFGGIAVLSAIGFVISALCAAEPILPLRLLTHYAVFTNSLMVFLQSSTQAALTLLIPVFFQVVKKASVAEAGAYLIPAFTGNLLGGLTSGYWIKRTGLFKVPTVVAPMLTIACMLLCLFTWHENISSWRAIVSLPGGFATAMVSSSTFVGAAAGVEHEDVAVAASTMYLLMNLGAVAGISVGSAVFEDTLRAGLVKAVEGRDDGKKILDGALSSIAYVQEAGREIRRIVVPAYVESFHHVNYLGLACSLVTLTVAVFSKGQRLPKS
ncbi:MFS general substrate transporter [Hortaea werneckii]|nr:MFS general substrate transporter [Hortaea werneckii]KAI7714702.1 MFS general substrate transporter [Hortaea werneckii]